MKKFLRYLRWRTCRYIYYADACPRDYRKNYLKIADKAICSITLVVGFFLLMVAIFFAVN